MDQPLTLTCLACGQRNRVAGERLAQSKCATCGARMVTGKPVDIDPATLDSAMKDGLPLVVDFWAAWCGPCRMMAPEFGKAAQAMEGKVRFAKIDTERFPEVSARFSIRGIPLLIRFRSGREAGRLAGARPSAQIADFAAAEAARA
jgi:thioredoxin 2